MFHEHILDEIFDIVQDQVWDTQIIKCFVDLLFLCLKMGQIPKKSVFDMGKS